MTSLFGPSIATTPNLPTKRTINPSILGLPEQPPTWEPLKMEYYPNALPPLPPLSESWRRQIRFGYKARSRVQDLAFWGDVLLEKAARRAIRRCALRDTRLGDERVDYIHGLLKSNNVFSYLTLSFGIAEPIDAYQRNQKRSADLFEAYIGACEEEQSQAVGASITTPLSLAIWLDALFSDKVWPILRDPLNPATPCPVILPRSTSVLPPLSSPAPIFPSTILRPQRPPLTPSRLIISSRPNVSAATRTQKQMKKHLKNKRYRENRERRRRDAIEAQARSTGQRRHAGMTLEPATSSSYPEPEETPYSTITREEDILAMGGAEENACDMVVVLDNTVESPQPSSMTDRSAGGVPRPQSYASSSSEIHTDVRSIGGTIATARPARQSRIVYQTKATETMAEVVATRTRSAKLSATAAQAVDVVVQWSRANGRLRPRK